MNILSFIKEVRARIEAATPGPWEYSANGMMDNPSVVINGHSKIDVFTSDADTMFVAEARTDLPRALDIIENQARQIKLLRDTVQYNINRQYTGASWVSAEALASCDAIEKELKID